MASSDWSEALDVQREQRTDPNAIRQLTTTALEIEARFGFAMTAGGPWLRNANVDLPAIADICNKPTLTAGEPKTCENASARSAAPMSRVTYTPSQRRVANERRSFPFGVRKCLPSTNRGPSEQPGRVMKRLALAVGYDVEPLCRSWRDEVAGEEIVFGFTHLIFVCTARVSRRQATLA